MKLSWPSVGYWWSPFEPLGKGLARGRLPWWMRFEEDWFGCEEGREVWNGSDVRSTAPVGRWCESLSGLDSPKRAEPARWRVLCWTREAG